jgi:hypothetical protein
MSLHRILPAVFCASTLLACGGGTPEPEAPDSAAEQAHESKVNAEGQERGAESEQVDANGPMTIPTTCHKDGDPCVPDPRWVKKLCADVYPGVALYLFQKTSPFTRGYISARKVKAVNASGGATSGEEFLVFDEQVVFLAHRAASSGGIQVSGAGDGYDAMRLDGSCVTLGSDEVRMNVPPQAKFTTVPWRYIGEDMENALREVPEIRDAYIERRKECKGAFSGEVSQKCITKDEALNRAIVKALESGDAKIPVPVARP